MTTNTFKPQLNTIKFKELLLHVAKQSSDDSNFGKTKLNKIFYYVDFMAFGMLGEPVTGATYVRRPYGPVPREIEGLRADLIADGAANVDRVASFNFIQERLVALRDPNLDAFSGSEIQLIDNVLVALRGQNAVGASELSHRELGWRAVSDRDVIPYETVFLSARELTSDDVKRGQEIWAGYSTAAA